MQEFAGEDRRPLRSASAAGDGGDVVGDVLGVVALEEQRRHLAHAAGTTVRERIEHQRRWRTQNVEVGTDTTDGARGGKRVAGRAFAGEERPSGRLGSRQGQPGRPGSRLVRAVGDADDDRDEQTGSEDGRDHPEPHTDAHAALGVKRRADTGRTAAERDQEDGRAKHEPERRDHDEHARQHIRCARLPTMPGAQGTPAAGTEGERWTREELRRLLAARFSPRGVITFVAASSRRSAEVRAARPALARQARRWLGVGAGGWVGLAGARVPPFRRTWPAGLAWWAATAVMLDWHLGMFETDDGRPRPLGLADALTLARAWLVPVAFAAPGPVVLAAGAASDVLDGIAARRSEPTRAGRDLEGLVDVCFTVAALGGLRRAGRLGPGPARAELLRLACGFSYALFAYFLRARAPDRELVGAARASTVMRLGGLIVAATGRRRLGDALVGTGCAVSVGLIARAVAAR